MTTTRGAGERCTIAASNASRVGSPDARSVRITSNDSPASISASAEVQSGAALPV